jgi:hypothetical protein
MVSLILRHARRFALRVMAACFRQSKPQTFLRSGNLCLRSHLPGAACGPVIVAGALNCAFFSCNFPMLARPD